MSIFWIAATISSQSDVFGWLPMLSSHVSRPGRAIFQCQPEVKMNMNSNSERQDSLEITGDSKPVVPAFTCLVYVHTNEDGTVVGRVANLAGIEARGASERFVLSKVTQAFKSQLLKFHEDGQDVPWIESPEPPSKNERVRSIPMHL